MRRNFTKKLSLFISLMCMFTCMLIVTVFGSVTSDIDISENGTMVEILDEYPGLESYLVSQLKAKNTGEIDVSDYEILGGAEEALEVVNAVINKHPELFYVNMNGGVTCYRNDDGYLLSIIVKGGYFTYSQDAFNSEVNILMNMITDEMSDLEKIITIHNYLCMDVEYAYDEFVSGSVTDLQHSAIGAIVNKTAVCDGYARAFSYYMDKLGIPCYVVTGTATTGGVTVSHAWNQVKLDGKWYFVDVSWDDPVPDWYGNIRYTYFLKSASDFADHSWAVNDFEICNSTKYDDSAKVFWNEISSQMFCVNGNVFYLKKADNKAMLIRHSLTSDTLTDEGTRLAVVDEKWYAFGSSTSYYPGNYSRLTYADGKVFYSTSDEIYAYDISTKEKGKVLDADVSKGYIYGLKAVNGKLYYQTATTPNGFDGEIKSCKVSELQIGTTSTATKKAITGKIKLSKSKYTYDGRAKKPTVTITGLKRGVDFKVSYSNNKNVGTATVKVTGIGKYKGTLKKTFKIVPKKVTLSKLTTPKKKAIKVSWKKVSGTGYQVFISRNKNFKNSTKFTVKGTNRLNITIKKKIVSGKRYYVKVRAYKVVKGKTYYGEYSRIFNKVAK